jgi:hypothetical protein
MVLAYPAFHQAYCRPLMSYLIPSSIGITGPAFNESRGLVAFALQGYLYEVSIPCVPNRPVPCYDFKSWLMLIRPHLHAFSSASKT